MCSYFPPCGAVSSTDRLVFCVTVALTGPEIQRERERERERERTRLGHNNIQVPVCDSRAPFMHDVSRVVHDTLCSHVLSQMLPLVTSLDH